MTTKIPSSFGIDVSIDRQSLIFRPNDVVTGMVKLRGLKSKLDLATLFLKAEGTLIFNHASKKSATADLLSTSVRPYCFFKFQQQLSEGKAIMAEKTEYPFKFKLEVPSTSRLMESYTGVYIIVHYEVVVELRLPTQLFKGNQSFYVQCGFDSQQSKKAMIECPRPLSFVIQPDQILKGASIQNKKTPDFKIVGKLKSDMINMNDEIEGTFVLLESDHEIKSIDLQLVRVENVETNEAKLIEATEVQNIQIADGNLIKQKEMLIYMVLPRFYSCPSFSHKEFSLNFELNLVFLFAGGFKVTQNFPIFLFRP